MEPGNEATSLPSALLAEIRAAAEEEHRPANEIVREALERYLEHRAGAFHLTSGATETGASAAAEIRELRKGNILPEGVTIRDLIDEGRA